ncbi:MAG: glycosyltransferase family 39 protein [Ignavibacteriaceae bacterium]|nr:glycosyltransferase family 39 protein [Ignavibacteriaceae bacterium]
MAKAINFLLSKFKYVLLLYFIIQIIFLFKFPLIYTSDSGYYFKLAQDCISHHGFYPLPQHLFEDYIVAPLYVNFIIILLLIFNSSFTIGIFNIVLNAIQIFLLYKITTIIIDEKAARISVILYILYLNNLGLVMLNLTELFFTVIVSGGLYFFLKQKSRSLFIAGIFCGLSIAIRPIGWALVLSFLTIETYRVYKKEVRFRGVSYLIAGLFIIVLLFGSISKLYFGEFIYTSNNGPLNILMGANDNANGGFYAKVFDKGQPGYIEHPENLTYYQKQEFWKNNAGSWITAHPLKWVMLFPKKLLNMFAWDDVSVSKIVFNNFNLYNFLKAVKEHVPMGIAFAGFSTIEIFIWGTLQVYHHLFYFFILFFFIFGIIKYRFKVFSNSDFNLLLLFLLIGIMMTIATIGDPRFKYPYMFIIFIFNSLFISNYFLVKEN